MTTRSALLRAFGLLTLGSMLVMAALSFYNFRRSMQHEIAGNLEFGASVVAERIDTLLYTRLEDMRVWRTLQVMQDITVGDVDKRVAGTLVELRAGHRSFYRTLICTNEAGRVVAASDPQRLGSAYAPATVWHVMSTAEPDIEAAADRTHPRMITLRTPIRNAFGQGNIGYLYASLDFAAVETLLDQAVADGPRDLMILDSQGNVIAASRALRQRVDTAALRLEDWKIPATGAVSYLHDGAPLRENRLLVGAAGARQYPQLAGLDWRVVIVESTRIAFAPVVALLWGNLALVALTMTVAAWIAARLAAWIAQPIVELTAFTRRIRQGQEALPEPPPTTITEAAELFDAYVDMIRALERSREQVVRAGKLAVVGEMAAIMAHEIRTPMSIVRSSAQLLDRQPDRSEKERELIGFMLSETERLNRLVTMLLECARPTPPALQPQDPHAIVHTVLDLIRGKLEAARVAVVLELTPRQVRLECDKEQMMQVFLNLFLNALQFMSNGGRLGIGTRLEGSHLLFHVEDDGPGIAANIRARIFDPFFSRRDGGIGLGLTIVQQIVQAHRGEISVASSEWGGAAFEMRFPLRDAHGTEFEK